MLVAHGDARMGKKEILELMKRKNWKRRHLAAALDMTSATVHAWFRDDRVPGGAASILMRLWLREARGEIRIVEVAQTEPVPA